MTKIFIKDLYFRFVSLLDGVFVLGDKCGLPPHIQIFMQHCFCIDWKQDGLERSQQDLWAIFCDIPFTAVNKHIETWEEKAVEKRTAFFPLKWWVPHLLWHCHIAWRKLKACFKHNWNYIVRFLKTQNTYIGRCKRYFWWQWSV